MKRAHIYAIQSAAGPIKVGFSREIEKRLAQLQTGVPFKLSVIAKSELRHDARMVESAAHALLASKRLHGEWFDVLPDEACAAIEQAIADIDRGLAEKRSNRASLGGPEAVEIIRELGLSQAAFARMARLHKNAVTKWANGSTPHGPAVTLLLLLQQRPELVRVLEDIAQD